MTTVQQTDGNFAAVRESARTHAPDRYYAALFAPAEFRQDLIAAAAFDGEIAHIARQDGDPALGEIRMAWWRDALARAGSGTELSGSPVLDAFADVARRRRLPSEMFAPYFDAHMDAVFADAPENDAALDARFQAIDGTPISVALHILTGTLDDASRALLSDAARAAGYARTATELPYALAAGRSPLPASWLAKDTDGAPDWRAQIPRLMRDSRSAIAAVRRQLAKKPRGFTTALLPLALIEPQFRALQRAGHEPERDIVEIAPLMRLWRVARAHWTGSV